MAPHFGMTGFMRISEHLCVTKLNYELPRQDSHRFCVGVEPYSRHPVEENAAVVSEEATVVV